MAMDRSSRPMHRGRKKVCSFCVDRVEHIDYKDLPRLRKYVSERAKIIPRPVTGTPQTGRAPQASQARPAPRMAGSLSGGGLWPPQKASSRSGEVVERSDDRRGFSHLPLSLTLPAAGSVRVYSPPHSPSAPPACHPAPRRC